MFCRLNREYACCKVNQKKPLLTVSAISFDAWLDTASGNLKSTPRGLSEFPTVVIKSVIPIADRTVLKNIQCAGIQQVETLRRLLTSLAAWLEANYTLNDFILVPPKSLKFNEHWLENGC